ncbi:MAG TPA: 23S rRNA (guanosine(2251)-2'-O)-methyltransferase RlmB [Gammaproteobacteria bacterium]|nr:23S rRNA (guanosine(2251)-2'-O)-methyltransferase RlmB [Gammaproteobacteria bacterium]
MSGKHSTTAVFGIHAVAAILERNAPRVIEIHISQQPGNRRQAEIGTRATALGIPVIASSLQTLDEQAEGVPHQGVMAVMRPSRPLREQDLDAILDALETPPLLLVLDGVQDPHNLGACLRTADAAGVHAVIVPKDRAVGLTPVVRKVASGAAEHVPFIQVTNLARTLRSLKARGIWVVGSDGEAEISLFEADLTGPLALVMGAEGKGMRRLTRECCDWSMAIPMAGLVESLNVSVATGVCLFEIQRQSQTKVKGEK